jgi:NADH-quinone oxidoreductase subunit J
MITEFFFLLFLVMAAAGSVMVVANRNPVASLMFLVLTLFSVAGLFVLLDAHFLAAVQVIVYAGAIMVLFLFVIMLLNLGHERESDLRGIVGRVTATVLGAGLFAALLTGLRRGSVTEMAGGMGPETVEAVLESRGAMGAVADPLFRDYVVPFEVTSLLLLVAVVGAIVLARRKAP